MSKYKNPTYSLRIDYTLQKKVRAIAEKEDRPISAQYERIVRDWIRDYEATNGEIQLDQDDQKLKPFAQLPYNCQTSLAAAALINEYLSEYSDFLRDTMTDPVYLQMNYLTIQLVRKTPRHPDLHAAQAPACLISCGGYQRLFCLPGN